ncbi:hypothetical protein RJ641_023495 [Dillenia turbinata]|uniref:Uncharacterized protein n=1 Tax=Dillenia turbinata TaxID=194707 RepID=A0AAN8YST8_9MAGN
MVKAEVIRFGVLGIWHAQAIDVNYMLGLDIAKLLPGSWFLGLLQKLCRLDLKHSMDDMLYNQASSLAVASSGTNLVVEHDLTHWCSSAMPRAWLAWCILIHNRLKKFRHKDYKVKADLLIQAYTQTEKYLCLVKMATGNWNAFDKPTDRPRQSCNGYTNTPLSPIQPLSTGKLLQEFNHYHLKNDRDCDYPKKESVLVYPRKNVLFLQLSSVKLIEHLAEHKGIEDECILHLLTCTKDGLTFELQGQQNSNLI